MKWYVLTLFLLVGFVCSVSAQEMDARLVGEWETHDGPCSPCILTIPASGKVTFSQVGDPIEVMYAQATPEPGINVILPLVQPGRNTIPFRHSEVCVHTSI